MVDPPVHMLLGLGANFGFGLRGAKEVLAAADLFDLLRGEHGVESLLDRMLAKTRSDDRVLLVFEHRSERRAIDGAAIDLAGERGHHFGAGCVDRRVNGFLFLGEPFDLRSLTIVERRQRKRALDEMGVPFAMLAAMMIAVRFAPRMRTAFGGRCVGRGERRGRDAEREGGENGRRCKRETDLASHVPSWTSDQIDDRPPDSMPLGRVKKGKRNVRGRSDERI